MDKMVILV